MEERYYTIEEVSEMLRVSIRTVYRWIKDGALRAVQVRRSGGYRIPKDALDEFIDSNTVGKEPTSVEIGLPDEEVTS